MAAPEPNRPDEQTHRRFTPQRKLAAVGLAAGLIGGGAAGMLMSNSPLGGAATVSVAQADEPADGATGSGSREAEHMAEVLAPLVQNGTINQDQADAVTAALMAAAPEHSRGPHGDARFRLGAAAEVIGMAPRELADALREGSTIAEVAAERGVDAQAVIDAMVAQATERLNAAVANGRITEKQASERLAGLTERVTDRVNNGLQARGPGAQDGPDGAGDDAGGD